jgi:hypothetical protein
MCLANAGAMTSIRVVRLVLASFVGTSLAVASSARADCVASEACLCPQSQEQQDERGAALTGIVEAGATGKVLLVDSRTAKATDGGTTKPAGQRVPLELGFLYDHTLAIGERIVAVESTDGSSARPLSTIGADGMVICATYPSFRIPEADAVAAVVSPSCSQDLFARGLPNGASAQCGDDTPGSGCSVASERFAAPRALHAGVLGLGVVALACARARRRGGARKARR